MDGYEDMLTDKQYEGHLVDEYFFLSELLNTATEENAVNTIKAIKRKMAIIRLKLPLDLNIFKSE